MSDDDIMMMPCYLLFFTILPIANWLLMTLLKTDFRTYRALAIVSSLGVVGIFIVLLFVLAFLFPYHPSGQWDEGESDSQFATLNVIAAIVSLTISFGLCVSYLRVSKKKKSPEEWDSDALNDQP